MMKIVLLTIVVLAVMVECRSTMRNKYNSQGKLKKKLITAEDMPDLKSREVRAETTLDGSVDPYPMFYKLRDQLLLDDLVTETHEIKVNLRTGKLDFYLFIPSDKAECEVGNVVDHSPTTTFAIVVSGSVVSGLTQRPGNIILIIQRQIDF